MPDRDDSAAYTGWTRSDWIALLGRLTAGFVRAVPAGGSPAAVRLPGPARDPDVGRIEGFARMGVAWAAWLHEPGNGVLCRDGQEIDVGRLLARGLADATDPAHPAFWGSISDRDQRIVEAAEVGTALLLGGERLRQALDEVDPAAHDRVLDWLALVDGRDVWPDNWVLFPMIAALARRTAGRQVPDRTIDDAIDWMWAHRDGDGWYRDGDGAALDLYTGWAIHWHLLWWAARDGDRRPRRRAEVVRRARAWLATMAGAVAADGAYPRFGRSLGYRFAFAAPFAQAALLGIDPLPPGAARRLASGVVARSIDDGAIDPASDWFRVGVAGERPEVVEPYVSTGASAWAAHAFVALAMPPDHPFWAAPEAPLPADLGRSGRLPSARAGWLVSWNAAGDTSLHNGRSGHPPDIADHDYAATYGKRTYRSSFPADIPVAGALGAGGDDAILALAAEAIGSRATAATARGFHRHETAAGGAGPRWTWSRFRLGSPDTVLADVSTLNLVLDDADVVVAAVRPRREIRIRAGGPALGRDATSWAGVDRHVDGLLALLADGSAAVGVRALAGFATAGVADPSPRLANLVHDRSAHPFVDTAPLEGPAVLAWATATGSGRETVGRALGPLDVAVNGTDVLVRWPDGGAVVAPGSAPPDQVSLDGLAFDGQGLRVAFASRDRGEIAAEQVTRVAGVVDLERPGVLGLVRDGEVVIATLDCGATLDRAWTGAPLTTVRARLGVGDWGPAIRLARPNEIPGELVRRVTRAHATRLVTLRLEPDR